MFNKIVSLSYSDNIDKSGLVKAVVHAGNGIFEIEKTWLGEKCIKVSDYIVGKDLPQLQNHIEFDKSLPKLPLEAFEIMLAFYKGIYEKHKTEAQINFYHNYLNLEEILVDEEMKKLSDISCLKDWGNGLISYVPIQTNSSVETSTTDPIYMALREQMRPYIETHSHNTMSAFKSGTDLNNSHVDGLQLVIGHITSDTYDFYNWVTIGAKQYDNLENYLLEQIIELPENFENKKMEDLPEVPEEWYGQHKTFVYSRKYKHIPKNNNYYKNSNNKPSFNKKYWDNFENYDYIYGSEEQDLEEKDWFNFEREEEAKDMYAMEDKNYYDINTYQDTLNARNIALSSNKHLNTTKKVKKQVVNKFNIETGKFEPVEQEIILPSKKSFTESAPKQQDEKAFQQITTDDSAASAKNIFSNVKHLIKKLFKR